MLKLRYIVLKRTYIPRAPYAQDLCNPDCWWSLPAHALRDGQVYCPKSRWEALRNSLRNWQFRSWPVLLWDVLRGRVI